jgi:hypothetical protein
MNDLELRKLVRLEKRYKDALERINLMYRFRDATDAEEMKSLPFNLNEIAIVALADEDKCYDNLHILSDDGICECGKLEEIENETP